MKITGMKSDSTSQQRGLILGELTRLPAVVGIFGKNGAGKTRLLNYVKDKLSQASANRFAGLEFKQDGFAVVKTVEDGPHATQPVVIDFKNKKIEDIGNFNENTYAEHSTNILQGFQYRSLKSNALKILKAFSNAHHLQNSSTNVSPEFKEKRQRLADLFDKMVGYVKIFLEKDISYKINEHNFPAPTLAGRPLISGELSEGEKELITFAIYLSLLTQDTVKTSKNSADSLKGRILLLDEPELNLHPEYQAKLITLLRELVGDNGQIWVATHSIAILSILNYEEVFLMSKGQLLAPSVNIPNKVLESLAGEELLVNLEVFVSSRFNWALVTFCSECLLPPKVVGFNNADPQLKQVTEALPVETTRILDFGAGKGRLGQLLLDQKVTTPQIAYFPLEPNKDYHSSLQSLVQQINSATPYATQEILDSYEKLGEKQYDQFFHRIVVCNVLHEISPLLWPNILNHLIASLSSDGSILILEDLFLAKGEHAHEFGFIVLGAEELRILFKLKHLPKIYEHKESPSRLMCCEIPHISEQIERADVINALKRRKHNLTIEINKLNEDVNSSGKAGRLLGFYSIQYYHICQFLEKHST